jgi:hypothetical protein
MFGGALSWLARDTPKTPATPVTVTASGRLWDGPGPEVPGAQRPADAHPAAGHWFEHARDAAAPRAGLAAETQAEYTGGLPPPEALAATDRAERERLDGLLYGRAPAPEMDPNWGVGATSLGAGFADGGPVGHPCSADPGEARRQADFPEPPDYHRPPTSTGRLLLEIDVQIAGSLASRNQILRRQLVDEQDRRERAERRVAELDLTVKALGKLIAHAAGHDKTGGE